MVCCRKILKNQCPNLNLYTNWAAQGSDLPARCRWSVAWAQCSRTHLMRQASITSAEHLAAYAEYCKRALSNAVNGPLLSKRDTLAHQARRMRRFLAVQTRSIRLAARLMRCLLRCAAVARAVPR